jgi:hypothetical protein
MMNKPHLFSYLENVTEFPIQIHAEVVAGVASNIEAEGLHKCP